MAVLDVTEEVLLRLSVKDAVRCKSVCKSWYSLITSPCFINRHLKHVCNKQAVNTRIAMTRRYIYRIGRSYFIPLEWRTYDVLAIVGSCNGLVCMSSLDNQICLTNPSTREFRKLHKPPVVRKDITYAQRYGFGYDSSAHDYKLVIAINHGCDGALVQILSLKSNVWKNLGHISYRFDDKKPGILFNGALYWFWYNANDDAREKVVIVSLDLATEEFTEIPQPCDDTGYVGNCRNILGIFQDQLCIFNERSDGCPYGIWVLNFKRSWELLPTRCEMKDRVHYMIKDPLLSKKMPSYFCCENTFLSRSGRHISCPIFVPTLVSPYVNNHGRQGEAKNNKRIALAATRKEWREIEEAHTLKDGEKNAFYYDTDCETERKKRTRKRRRIRKNKRLM